MTPYLTYLGWTFITLIFSVVYHPQDTKVEKVSLMDSRWIQTGLWRNLMDSFKSTMESGVQFLKVSLSCLSGSTGKPNIGDIMAIISCQEKMYPEQSF